MRSPTVWYLRHGEAWHNVAAKQIGDSAYQQMRDPFLTKEGKLQAEGLVGLLDSGVDPKHVGVLCSPLQRTLQTASIAFPYCKIVAHDALLELPQTSHICNWRRTKKELVTVYPDVDFSLLPENSNPFDVDDSSSNGTGDFFSFPSLIVNLSQIFGEGLKVLVLVSHESVFRNLVQKQLIVPTTTTTTEEAVPKIPFCHPIRIKFPGSSPRL